MVSARTTPATGGVDSGEQHQPPQSRAEHQIGCEPSYLQSVEADQQQGSDASPTQRREVELRRVEDGDHQHRPQVIDDGQGGEEYLQAGGNPRAQQGQYAQREGDVGGRRYGPPTQGFGIRCIDGGIDQPRNDHTARRGDPGERAVGPGGELAVQELAFDLQADEQKEQGHQPVVDPVQHVEPAQGGVENLEVASRQRRVGYEEGQRRCAHEENSAGGLAIEEFAEDRRATNGRAHGVALRAGGPTNVKPDRPLWPSTLGRL
jgi:hypothetical protein